MKIEKVEKNYSRVLGDAEIHMNVDGKFYLKLKDELPIAYKYDQLPECDTLIGMRKLVKQFCEDCIRQTPLGRKIYISVKSSTKVVPYNIKEMEAIKQADKWSMLDTDTFSMYEKGDGFSISYVVFDTFNYKYKAKVGTEKPYIKNHVVQHDPIYGWLDKTLYQIVSTNDKDLANKAGQLLEHRDAFFSFKPTHTMDYTPEVDAFLQSISVSIKSMVEKIVNFFNVEPDKLMVNMLESGNTKLLPSGT